MNVGSILPKVIGAGAFLYTAKDIATTTANLGLNNGEAEWAEISSDTFVKQQFSDKPSLMKEDLRKGWQKHMLDARTVPGLLTVKGVISEGINKTINNIVPLALSVGALATKGIASKFCAGLLVLGGIKLLFRDVMCIGQKDI